MSIFHHKAAPDAYTFASVSEDNETAVSIQHNVDLLRYMADHPQLTKQNLASYLDMLERYGMSTGTEAQRAEFLAHYVPDKQSTQVRTSLAKVHLDELTDRIKELGKGTPTAENIRMIEFAVAESQKTKSAFV